MRTTILSLQVCLFLSLGGCTEQQPAQSFQQSQQQVMLPPRFEDSQLVGGLADPVSMTFAPDGRIFVCEQGGRLRIIQDGKLLPEPFLRLNVDPDGERGLLGVALDPEFPDEPYVYVYYTATSPSEHNRLSRFTAAGNRAAEGSERVLLDLEPLGSATNHNGGAVHFGTDGMLYVSVGDNARSSNAQALTNLYGKVLRFDKNGGIPSDNPFFTRAEGNRRSIWALGLRNPFSFAVQPGTGRLFINDVGQSKWEELNEGQAGRNYGWPDTEGPTSETGFSAPLYAYQHNAGEVRGCAIAGGTFYNPLQPQFPAEYVGKYFFADYCEGWIRMFNPQTRTVELFTEGADAPVDLDVGPDGALYYLDRGAGTIHRIRFVAPGQPPTIPTQPESQRVAVGQPVTFTVGATGTPPLSYQWQRDGKDVSGKIGSSLVLERTALGDSGARFRVRVSNNSGSVLSTEAVLTVTRDAPPVATVLSPAEGALFTAGQAVTFSGRGTDAEDGTLPASAFTWRVDLHHDEHLHPLMPPTSGQTGGTFMPPEVGETSSNVWYRIHLSVRDSQGITHEVFRDILPSKVKMTFATEPAGLQLTLDGQPQSTPGEVTGVVGVIRTLGAVSPQTVNGVRYVFDHWSDGGAETHDMRTPAADTLYRASFRSATSSGGAGLHAEYFEAPDLTQPRLQRVDPTVDFRWGLVPPDVSLAADLFSVRWSGSVVPKFSETYTFFTVTNDGVRLWVDGKLLIDNWTTHKIVEDSGTIALQAGRAYSLRMEYFENKGTATARLLWSSPSQRKQVIPAECLQPAASSGP